MPYKNEIFHKTKTKKKKKIKNYFIDYEYDFYGYSDYRGAGYNDTYYEDFYRTYDGEYFFDYPPSSMVGPLPPGGPTAAGGLPRTARNNVVGF